MHLPLTSRVHLIPSVSAKCVRSGVLLIALLVPPLSTALPSLDSDQRMISVDTEPPFGMLADMATPAVAFDPFVDLVTQGGFEMCQEMSSNASSSAAQDTMVAPLAFGGTGSAAFNIEAGSCSGASADVQSIFEITFTTDAAYDFDFDATLNKANVLLENDDGTPFMSWTEHTGGVADLQVLPIDTYTIRVDVSFFETVSPTNIASDSGDFDFSLALLPVTPSPRNVTTQDISRAAASVHLLNLGPPNTLAHGEVDADYLTSSVATFTASSLAGVDTVYLSPAQAGQLGLTTSEIDTLVAFVDAGGHLIIPADNQGAGWFEEFVDLAAAFGVSYSGVSGFETSAIVVDGATPLTNGPGGVVASYVVGPPHHSGITSTDPDFVEVAEYSTAATALGYLPPNGARLGHVTFLTDFNTFFDSEIVNLDSAALWTNLFSVPEPVGAAPLFVGIEFLVLARRRS